MADNAPRERIDFVVGEERGLREVISEAEIAPLLMGVISGGAHRVLLRDQEGETLWSLSEGEGIDLVAIESPLTLEGERVGLIVVEGPKALEGAIRGLAGLLTVAVQSLATNNLKRMLTTEIHTTVVNLSYDELLESNRQLALSEARYRELAEGLERTVEERTRELQKAHSRLLQQEKLAAVGQLAAGLAHEINNPLGFISSNLNALKRYVDGLKEMVALYRETIAQVEIDDSTREQLAHKAKTVKLDFITSDIDELIDQSREGCLRVGRIVADLKGFSHIDESEEVVVDLNQEIDRTLSVLGHQIPADARIIKRYGRLPGFACNGAELCQVFLNIIQNAIQARPMGLALTIDTKEEDGRINLLFTDNGPGITPEVMGRIFEPFFTTREVGKGMGMGLAVAYDVITAYHGTIEALPRLDREPGTTLVITLPLRGKNQP